MAVHNWCTGPLAWGPVSDGWSGTGLYSAHGGNAQLNSTQPSANRSGRFWVAMRVASGQAPEHHRLKAAASPKGGSTLSAIEAFDR